MIQLDAEAAVARYEAIRRRLPAARFAGSPRRVANLGALVAQFDVWLLDAFGVLNVGETVVPTALDRVASLQAAGKRVLVLTNGATDPAAAALEKYRAFGFDFAPQDIVSSRDALIAALPGYPGYCWGVMGKEGGALDDLAVESRLLTEDPAAYRACDGFLLLSSTDWNPTRQQLLQRALVENPRPVLVGNPDLVAPREQGLSLEPGYFAHQLADATAITPTFFGKPFDNVYAMAFARAAIESRQARVIMVGDTLHTDVLGGAAAGVATALITGHGLLTGLDVDRHIAVSGIVPDFIVNHT